VCVSAISRFVALGDSFTEGIGDPHPDSPNGLRGWADIVASHLAHQHPDFRYANLAVRGRTMDDVITAQIDAAVLLKPDFVTIYAGMNDLLKLRTNLDGMMARYAEALATLKRTGARVMTFTAADIGFVPVFRRLRGRAAIYNELLRAAVDDLGIELVDFWRFSEYRDSRMWDSDRIHLSALGHRQMAARVLDALGTAAHVDRRRNGVGSAARRQPACRLGLGRRVRRAVGDAPASAADPGRRRRAEDGQLDRADVTDALDSASWLRPRSLSSARDRPD
jgi:lysophospholipase L1-like esterase